MLGRRVNEFLGRWGLLRAGTSVPDLVGCGPGSLAVPLAEAGARVVGLDTAPGMTPRSRPRPQLTRLGQPGGPLPMLVQGLGLTLLYDFVLPAFFPKALKPARGWRVWRASPGKGCVLVLAAGAEPFVFRRELWRKFMGLWANHAQASLVRDEGEVEIGVVSWERP